MIMRFLLFYLFFSQLFFAQQSYERMHLVSIDDYDEAIVRSTKLVVLERDTLVDISKGENQFKISPILNNYNLMYDYYYMTSYKDNVSLVFWKKPIVIYISDDFSEAAKEELQLFVKDINDTGALRIAWTKKKEKSNLMILNHSSVPDFYDKKFIEKLTNDQVQKLLFYNATYTLFKQDSEIHSGYIRVNLNRIKERELVDRTLKRILYASLGFFIDHKKIQNKSILNRELQEKAILNDYDKQLLKIHYDHLTDLKVSARDVYQLYMDEHE